MIRAPVNTVRLFEAFDFTKGADNYLWTSKSLSLRALSLYPRHGTGCAIKPCDVGKEQKLEHAKRGAARAHSRKFQSGSAGFRTAGPGRVLDGMEPPLPGVGLRPSGTGRPLGRKGQSSQGQRGRQSRPKSLLRHSVCPDLALFRRRSPVLPHRRHCDQGGHRGENQISFSASSSPPPFKFFQTLFTNSKPWMTANTAMKEHRREERLNTWRTHSENGALRNDNERWALNDEPKRYQERKLYRRQPFLAHARRGGHRAQNQHAFSKRPCSHFISATSQDHGLPER